MDKIHIWILISGILIGSGLYLNWVKEKSKEEKLRINREVQALSDEIDDFLAEELSGSHMNLLKVNEYISNYNKCIESKFFNISLIRNKNEVELKKLKIKAEIDCRNDMINVLDSKRIQELIREKNALIRKIESEKGVDRRSIEFIDTIVSHWKTNNLKIQQATPSTSHPR